MNSPINLGQLFYLMGASGAGKDSLIDYAEHHLTKPDMIRFVHRHITRKGNLSNNNRDYYILKDEFELLRETGHFAMNWERHGICYGITHKIDSWLRAGKNVVINGSRQHYNQARQDYPELHAIWVTADQPVLWQRLQKRGRETSEKISERMQAADKFGLSQANSGDKFSIIDNNGLLQIAGEKFLNILQSSPAK